MSSNTQHEFVPACDLYERHLVSALFEPYAVDRARGAADYVAGPVLEMACGTGIVTRQLRTHLKPTVSLMATDINPGMLDYAQKRLKDLEEIGWQQADIADRLFSDASFHVAVCQFGLMFVPDKDHAFYEVQRALVNGGLLAFSVWDRMENNPWGGVIVHETVAGFLSENPPQLFKAPFNSHDVDVLRSLLTANGFD